MKRSAAPRRDMPSTSTAWTILLRKSIDVTLPMRIPFSNEGPGESENPILNKGEMLYGCEIRSQAKGHDYE
jgi:hypothetical protein